MPAATIMEWFLNKRNNSITFNRFWCRSYVENLMIGLEGVGFKYRGWVWSGDVTVSFWEVVAALESRSP